MDFDSPDVEKDFPGLYASETGSGRSRKNNDVDDFSDHGDHGEKLSKKELLLGRRKEKKDKKDRGYATLDGESSPEEEPEVKSPSKSKKSKAFKFATSKSKEKREKSRDKESHLHRSSAVSDGGDSPAASLATVTCGNNKSGAGGTAASGTLADPDRNTLSASIEHQSHSGTLHKKDKKDKKDKDKEKKDKSAKEKEKKDKKSKQSSLNDAEILELGDAQPIFGVSLGLAVERSRCHDQINLPLVVRDCIDYLQEHGLLAADIYKVDAAKGRLQQLKRLYNNRESLGTGDWDVPTACGLLKLFFKELPEPILTTDLSVRFEEAASLSVVTQQHAELTALVQQLPSYNQTLLAWTLRHFDAVIQHERQNKTNAQSLAMLLSPALQMSHRLLVCMLCHCPALFELTELTKYVPPITAASPNLPDTSDAIQLELRKQDSLLNQIHAEMNAGYVTKKREEQLWEVQRIITQLKRKLRSFEKKTEAAAAAVAAAAAPTSAQHTRSLDDAVDGPPTIAECPLAAATLDPAAVVGSLSSSHQLLSASSSTRPSGSDDDSLRTATAISAESTPHTNNTGTRSTPHGSPSANGAADGRQTTTPTTDDPVAAPAAAAATPASGDQMYMHAESGLLMLPPTHPDCPELLRVQVEKIELIKWKTQLQRRITNARTDIVWLRNALRQLGEDDHLGAHKQKSAQQQQQLQTQAMLDALSAEELSGYERIVAHYAQENALLEHKKQLLVREVFDENVELINMQVALTMKNFKY